MTPERILQIAYGFEQYPGAKEPTLRGQAIVEFARAIISEVGRGILSGDEVIVPLGAAIISAALEGQTSTPVVDSEPHSAVRSAPHTAHYTPPGTHSSAAAPKESA